MSYLQMHFSNYAVRDTFITTGKETLMLFWNIMMKKKKGDILNHNQLIFRHNSQGCK